MGTLNWQDSTRSEGCRYHRHGTIIIEAGRGSIKIDVCVPSELASPPQLKITFTKTLGDRIENESYSAVAAGVSLARPAIRDRFGKLGHRFADVVAGHVQELLDSDAKPIDQALNDSLPVLPLEEARRLAGLRRGHRPADSQTGEVPDGYTDFGKPDVLSRSGKGGMKTSRVARKQPRARLKSRSR